MDVKMPELGWESALSPCGECLQVLGKSDVRLAHAGQQASCYDCQNKMTLIRLGKEAESIFDIWSSLGKAAATEYLLVGALFERSMGNTEATATTWFAGRADEALQGFKACETQARSEWVEFQKESFTHNGEHVYSLIEPGIIGRFVRSTTSV